MTSIAGFDWLYIVYSDNLVMPFQTRLFRHGERDMAEEAGYHGERDNAAMKGECYNPGMTMRSEDNTNKTDAKLAEYRKI
jgi:hypothetical protein